MGRAPYNLGADAGAPAGTTRTASICGGPRSCFTSLQPTAKKYNMKMTSVMAWAGVDSRAVASLNFCTDSRISWPGGQVWDQGRKTFMSTKTPQIFCYWGDVLFPALALPVIIDHIDSTLIAPTGRENWHDVVQRQVRRLWIGYPTREKQDLRILHGLRMGVGLREARFSLSFLKYDSRTDQWSRQDVTMPERSAILVEGGTGVGAVRETYALWQESDSANTSRAAYSAFCESLTRQTDPKSGGPPQMVALYRVGNGRMIGSLQAGRRYVAGAELVGSQGVASLEWRNSLFEIVDPVGKKRKAGAQIHLPRQGG
jgi:hypothetical protein